MKTCKVAVFYSAQKPILLEEAQLPELKPGEILVKNEYTTLCRSDLNTFCGKRIEKTPTILGHEIVGRITAFGSEQSLRDLRGFLLHPGDRITWAIYASDPEGDFAKAGMPQKAPDLFKYGHEPITATSHLHGGLGEYTLLRRHTPVIKINEQVPVQLSALINCSVATVSGALRVAGDLSGKKVLISGAGMLGMIACAMSKTRGAASVTVRDINPERLKIALEFGADEGLWIGGEAQINEENAACFSKDFHVLIELSGVASAMEETLTMLGVGGIAVWIGATYPEPKVRIDGEKVVRNLWTIRGLHNYNQEDLMTAVDFIEKNYDSFPFETMIYDQFELAEVNEAFKYALKENPFRVGVRID